MRKFEWDYPHTFDQTATHTFIGFLIDPKYGYNVPIAWNSDLGSPMNQKELRRHVQQYRDKKRSLYQLLTQSLGSSRELPRNELIVEGTPIL